MTAPWAAAFIGLWILVFVIGVVLLGTLRRLIPLIERDEARRSAEARHAAGQGLMPGAAVPAFAVQAIDGRTLSESDLQAGRTVVLFLGSACPACERLFSDLTEGHIPDLEARLILVVDDAHEARVFAAASAATVVIQEDRSVARIFESNRIPHALVIDDGIVRASATPNDWESVRDVLNSTSKGGAHEAEVAAAAVVTT